MAIEWQLDCPRATATAAAFLARHRTLHDLIQAGGEVLHVRPIGRAKAIAVCAGQGRAVITRVRPRPGLAG
jgi:hypothetical protein